MTDQEIIKLLKEAFMYANPELTDRMEIMTHDSTLSDFGVSSIGALEMAAYVEEKLGTQFPDDELTSIMNIRGFMNLIRQYT